MKARCTAQTFSGASLDPSTVVSSTQKRALRTWNPPGPRTNDRTGAPQASTNNHLLRMMPIGGSITYGQGSTDGNGYRDILRGMLTSAGYHVDMVGSRKTGIMEDNEHEGWRGFRIDQIMGKVQLSLPKHEADIFWVNAGSNDCLQNFEIPFAGQRMQSLLNLIWKTCPTSTILLSTLLVNAQEETNLRTSVVNQCFRSLVENNAHQGRRIVLVDMGASSGPRYDELMDGTHPNDVGYQKMAGLWFQGIQQAIRKGYVNTNALPLYDWDNTLVRSKTQNAALSRVLELC